jgi:hypothetical protein
VRIGCWRGVGRWSRAEAVRLDFEAMADMMERTVESLAESRGESMAWARGLLSRC